ncbi:MAG: hypothetical protein WBO16_10455 [Gammaproteobacteria bacterium]
MAMLSGGQVTVEASLEKLAKDLEPSIREYTAVNRCRDNIQNYLGQFISSFTIDLPGAFARTSMASPLGESVIDMLVLFNISHSKKFFPRELLDKLHVTLQSEYPGTTFDEATESVYVPIEGFRFKVQPGFVADQRHYLVPAPGWNEWVKYDFLGYKSLLLRMNAQHNGKLLHVIRMIKAWNRLSGRAFNEYFLELMVNEVLFDYEIQTYQSAISHIFRAVLDGVPLKQHDPANECLLVEGLHDLDEVINAMLHVKCSYQVTRQALEREEQGRMKEALSDWAQLFPEVLPC